MLKAFITWLWPQDALKTHIEPVKARDDWMTRAEFEAAIQKMEQRMEWEMSEWYDKFSTLHARTAKRSQRERQGGNGNGAADHEPAVAGPTSILHLRRKPWSV